VLTSYFTTFFSNPLKSFGLPMSSCFKLHESCRISITSNSFVLLWLLYKTSKASFKSLYCNFILPSSWPLLSCVRFFTTFHPSVTFKTAFLFQIQPHTHSSQFCCKVITVKHKEETVCAHFLARLFQRLNTRWISITFDISTG